MMNFKRSIWFAGNGGGRATLFYNEQGILIMNVYGFLWNVDTFEL